MLAPFDQKLGERSAARIVRMRAEVHWFRRTWHLSTVALRAAVVNAGNGVDDQDIPSAVP